MNKEKFLNTELGASLEECIKTWDKALEERRKATPGLINRDYQGLGFEYWNNTCKYCQAQFEVYQMAIKQIYGVEYHFTRTDEYFGLVTEDETDWLFKFERGDGDGSRI